MADEINKRPGFFEAFLEDILEDVKCGAYWRLVPFCLGGTLLIGGVVACWMPISFWAQASVVVAFYAAFVTVNGLLLALCWNSFAKIFETASAPGFAGYLIRNNVYRKYVFLIQYIQLTQVASLLVCIVGLILSVVSLGDLYHRTILAVAVASLLYALWYASGAVRLMQDLVWYRAQFDLLREADHA